MSMQIPPERPDILPGHTDHFCGHQMALPAFMVLMTLTAVEWFNEVFKRADSLMQERKMQRKSMDAVTGDCGVKQGFRSQCFANGKKCPEIAVQGFCYSQIKIVTIL